MQTRWGAVFALWFAGLCAAGQFSKIGVIFPELATLWPGAGARLGLVVSVVGVVGVIFGTTAGLLVVRLGARRLIIGALIAGAVISALQCLQLPLGVMIASRVLEGFAHLAIVVAGPVLIAGAAAPRDQAAAMTLWSTFFGLAFTVTALFGLPLAQSHGAAALWAIHAVLMVLAAALLVRVLPPEARQPAQVPLRLPALLSDTRAIYASPSVAAPAMGFVFYTLIFVAALTLVPGLVAPQFRALTATVMPLVSIASSLGVGVALTRRLGAVRVVQIGFAGGALAALLWLLASGLGQVGAALLISASLGLVQGASFAAIPELNPTPEARARAAGAIAQLGNVGTTLGTPVLLALAAQLGPAALTLFTLPLCLGGIAVHVWLRRRRTRF
ncbi:MFS transporter [Paenirhodobacter sp. CAU 1674]|uniref:MFS transporter n=1 Tax=Paenirhodobacter sp. CAU 1674 TaxID=3032596 RepID=UPI0023DB5253|nr:MFS transporter [Paenirhodobacter sp. CAU 1674]MDF2142693.1 MFS transporter [Paenirhodobacter sp. CAU 1674]